MHWICPNDWEVAAGAVHLRNNIGMGAMLTGVDVSMEAGLYGQFVSGGIFVKLSDIKSKQSFYFSKSSHKWNAF
jgi:hypothetical protein